MFCSFNVGYVAIYRDHINPVLHDVPVVRSVGVSAAFLGNTVDELLSVSGLTEMTLCCAFLLFALCGSRVHVKVKSLSSSFCFFFFF